ncbi:M48 family metallopeptidase [Ethanoligenens harbinense]|uniref:YgjP-like metallopeptidase domain-containing protein n=1 Tax=Ethanoligenens harbinense (strain DSM 18485 / JCM 12961 / CGMCC 1.5033 / YUAN-3) TaxID=663278 RepID=E6U5F4_ETHHY|nr:SprT family zinc-dependent metalloprotease [Ethanoligenens harbinense]ADU25621.1 protein of unknown function DUF45 [Ethanoligenens harbinense YUAN-3]AYF37489.1 M48 family peptidase [Ethanoligenens harbinense]
MAQIPYTLVRSTRKTVAIQIRQDGEVIVRAPQRMPAAAIESFLCEKQRWVESARKRMRERAAQRACAAAEPGGTLWYLGRPYPVAAREDADLPDPPVWDGNAFYLPSRDPARAAAAFFTARAEERLLARAAFFAKQAGLSYPSLTVGSARSRWGSCGKDNRLRFSWRLLCAPPPAVDYVVAHELAHIRHHDHSPAFWREVARVWPEWETGADALRLFERQVDLRAL